MRDNILKAHSSSRINTFFHTDERALMRASVECRIRSDRKNSKGNAPVYLQVIINSERTQVPLKVSWPVKFFDNKAGKFLDRFRDDQEATDFNILVNKEKAKVNDIFMYYRHSDLELTVEQFKREYKLYGYRKDFILWTTNDIEERYAQHKIDKQTWKNHRSEMKKLKEFKEKIKFGELNEDFLETAEAWLRRDDYSVNSIISILSTVKNYAKRAYKAGIAVNLNSLKNYKMPQPVSRIIFLEPDELSRFEQYYCSSEISETHKQVLAHFIFSCYTGLRFSDIIRIEWKHIINDVIVLVQYKGRKKQKENRIPLIDMACQYIHNNKGKCFNTFTEPATNRILKEIASHCNVRKNVTTHVARHTFATEFLRLGGHIQVLQKLLGHAKITTTMIYTHVTLDTMKEQMQVFRAKIVLQNGNGENG